MRTISEIETIIIADFNNNTNELNIHSTKHTPEQINRLRNGLIALGESQTGLKYYILPENEFYETDFKKVSHGGIQGYRYKDLRDFLDKDDIKDSMQIANKLNGKTWR